MSLPHSKKTRALLAYLAVVGRVQSRDHLCRLFWEVPDDPRASLRWSLHKIREITNEDSARLISDRSSVVLTPETIDLDFRRVASHRSSDLVAVDRTTLESLAAEFRGEFLEGLSLPHCPEFEAWRIYHRDVALRLRVEILRELINRLRDSPEKGLFYARMLESLTGEYVGRQAAIVHPIRGWQEPTASNNDFDGLNEIMPAPLEQLAQLETRRLNSSADAAGLSSDFAPRTESQEIRFCKTADGTRIAYATCGRGPPVVRAAHWMSHLQYDWESPVWRHWIDALSDQMTLIRYDERGNGLSDWDVQEISFAAMIADLESVIDAAGLGRFILLGVSQSCAVSVAYAVRYPERVSGLILYGGFVKGWRNRSDPHEVATHEAMTTLIREGWGQNNPVFRHLFTTMFIPGANQEQMDWFDELQRITVSPDNACRLHEAFGAIDVSDKLSQISVPTLVLHARHDAAVPFQSGREFASGIAGARFVDLDSANHILLSSEPAFEQFAREVKRFVTETAG